MGGSKTKHLYEHGRMQVSLSKTSHIPGETIFGQIQVQLEQNYPTKEVFIEVSGQEKVYFETHENKHTHIHKNKQDVFHQAITVQHLPDGVLPAG